MPQTRLILLIFFVTFSSHLSFSQEAKAEVRQEIYGYICEADKLLNELNFKESLLISKKALNLAYSHKQYDYVAMSYNTIGGCHEELFDIKKALQYYEKALVFAHKTQNDTIKDWIYNNIGNIYNFELKDYTKGIYNYEKSLSYALKNKDTTEIIFTKLNLTWAYFNQSDFALGLPHLNYIQENINKYGDPESFVIMNNLLGMYHSATNEPAVAEDYFNKAIALGIRYKQDMSLADAYEEYSKHLYSKGNFKKAYDIKGHYESLKDEIHNQEKIKSAQIAGIQIELDESKREIGEIEMERYAQEKNLRYTKIIVILFMAVVIVLLLLLYTFYKNNLFRKKVNQKLLESNEELIIAKDKAEESSVLKSQFISTVTHELRTPLYGVIGITDLILDEHRELENSQHINSLKFSAKYLLSLVNDLLQIHKIEDRKIVLDEIPLNIHDEIEKVNQALQFIAIKNQNIISIEIDKNIPEFLIGDKLRLSQILVNLVSNALKFTKKGEIRLMAKLDRIERNVHFVKFEISDNGVGIAIENQKKIFEKFVQIDRKEGDYQGTGLGLSIVKKLLELLGSQIHLESEENLGTKITFTIPFEHNEELTRKYSENIEVDTSSAAAYRILVVEDNKINQMVTRKIIEKHNFECIVVDDGYAALEILKTTSFDLILMDINMPIINGFETTRMIREQGMTVPVVALTAYDKDEIAEEASLSGMNDILIKPFEPVRLFQVISSQISKSKPI